MILSRNASRTLFVTTCVISSVFLTYRICARAPQVYEASLDFQIASSQGQDRPDLQNEKKLLLSDAILTQVLKEANLLPQADTDRFRSFDLGPKIKKTPANSAHDFLDRFKERLEIKTYPDNSALEMGYKSHDPEEARKIIETLFEKFRDWRQSAVTPKFDGNIIATDQQLVRQREAFLQSQKSFLDFVEGGGSPESLSSTQTKKSELMARLESLKLRYGPKHPAMIETLREIDALEAIPKKIPDQAKIKQLREKMEQNFKALDTAIRESVVSEQQKENSRNVFEILPLGEVEVKPVPVYASYKMFLAGIGALLLSLLCLKIRAGIRPVFETQKDVVKFLKFSFVTEIQALQKKDTDEVIMPSAITAEALRSLRQELKLRADPDGMKLVTVTSTHMQEGRSELIASLGRIAARSGEHVLILDADLRAPTLQEKLPAKFSRNLVDYLSGQARVEDVINRTDPSGVHVIYGTAIPNTALDLISSEKMKTLLHSLREVYDLVMVQAPPVPKGPDARVLGAISDQTLYLVEGGKTLRDEVKSGLDAFSQSGVEKLAVVLVQN